MNMSIKITKQTQSRTRITMRTMMIRITGMVLATFLLVPTLLAQQSQSASNNNDQVLALHDQMPDEDSEAYTLLNQVIELNFQNASLEEALNVIANQANLKLMYRKTLLPEDKKVSYLNSSKTVYDALWDILDGTGIQFAISQNRQLVLLRLPNIEVTEENAMQETVTGRVTDGQTGQPLPGVNIVIEGTTIGTSTDSEGYYELSVPSLNETLIYSYIGYLTLEISIENRSEISIELEPGALMGEELVVVGYGAQRRVNLTGSVSSIDVDTELQGRAITDATQILAGQSAGVQVRQSTGQPGADDAMIRIRGIGTLNDASPLIIVDGVESSLSDLNPNDIQNISILKDAASASIYGSRAANGVVLVTTKTGRQGAPILRYDGYASVQSPMKIHDMVTNFTEYMHLVNDFYTNSGLPARFDFNDPMVANWEENSRTDWRFANSNHYADVLKPDWSFNHNLSVSGGGDNTTYLASVGYLDNRGIVENAAFERYSGRLNLQTQATDWLVLGTNATGLWSTRDLTDAQGIFTTLTSIPPGFVLRSPDGRFGGNQALTGAGSNANPLRDSHNRNGNYERTKVFSKFYSHINLRENVRVESSFSIDYDNLAMRRSDRLIDRWDFIDDIISNRDSGVDVRNRHERNYRYVIDHLIRYNDTFAGLHNVDLIAGYNQDYSKGEWFYARINNVIDESTNVLGAGLENPQVDGNAADRSLQSFFGRANYNYDEKYLFEANLRYDGSSKFAEGNRWGLFPSFSAGWRLSEENFMAGMNGIDNLTVRASWGQLGNNRIGDYEYQAVYNARNYPFGGSVNSGAAPGSIANAEISWEKTEMLNFGILLNAFANRFEFEIDLFERETQNILVNLPIPGVLGGLTSPRQNVGVVRNRGLDIQMGWTQHVNSDFSFGINGNLGYVKDKVLKFDGDNPSHSNENILLEGHPIWAFYVREVDRMVRTQEDVDWVEQQLAEGKSFFPSTPQLGDLVYKDLNGDGVYGNDDDRVISDKSNNPNLVYGFSAYVNWKGFDLSMLWQGVAGVYGYYRDPTIQPNRRAWGYPQRLVGNTWTPETPNAEFPRATWADDNQNVLASDFWLKNASYIKLKNLQIGYSIPTDLTSVIGVQNRIRVYASGENLLTFTGWEGLDPETVRLGANQRVYPTMRQILFGINITF